MVCSYFAARLQQTCAAQANISSKRTRKKRAPLNSSVRHQNMEREAFISKLDELKHRSRTYFWGVGTLVFLFNLATIAFVFHRYPPSLHNPSALGWYLAAFAAASIAVFIFALLLRQVIAQYAPTCANCGTIVTWRHRSQGLNSERCPKCSSELMRGNA
jgi:DNA-directed RNA polymerase subunit RPC12/RpoP